MGFPLSLFCMHVELWQVIESINQFSG